MEKRKQYNMHKLKEMLPHQFERFFTKLVNGEVTYKNRFNQIVDYSEKPKTIEELIYEAFAKITN